MQDGTLSLDREIRYYWPEFAVRGKAGVTLWMLLAHRAGAIGAEDGFTLEEMTDDRVVADRVGAPAPSWRPDAACGYHSVTMGALAGEVARRATGVTLRGYYEERLRRPYGIDLYLGLPAELETRVVPVLPPELSDRERELARFQAADSLGGIRHE